MSCTTFNELRLEEELCDVVICVDNVEFRAHKIILCSCSNYFRSVLETRGDGGKEDFLVWVTLPEGISSASISTNTLIQQFATLLVPLWTPELTHNLVSSSSSGSGV